MYIVTVAPLKKGILQGELSYFTSQKIEPGKMVEISIRNKKTTGIVTGSILASLVKGDLKDSNFELKKIDTVNVKPIFSKAFIESAFLFADYSASQKSDILNTLIPSFIKKEHEKVGKILADERFFDSIENKNIKSEKLLFQASYEERISFYKTLIRESFADKKSIFLVLPGENDIEKYAEALSKGIERFTFKLHSRIPTRSGLIQYEKILNSEHPILIIGTPQFLSITRTDLQTIILEKESVGGYRTIAKPYADLRIFTEIFSSKIDARLIFADTLLRFDEIGRKDLGELNELRPLNFRLNYENEIIIKERNKERDVLDKSFKIFEENTIEEIKNTLSKNQKVFIFALRKGLATMTVCKDCGEILFCDKCSAPVVLYLSKEEKKRLFFCNHCKTEKNVNTVCSRCNSWNLLPIGIGTDTVVEELRNIFPGKNAKIFKLDKETAKNKKAVKDILENFRSSKSAVLVGTEMALHYLEDDISLSVIASFDSLFSIPNFKAGEKILQIITGISSKTKKRLIIETKNPNNLVLQSIQNQNLISFVREDLSDRKNLGYPPFARFIKITYSGDKDETREVKKFLTQEFSNFEPLIYSGFIGKIKDKYITHALIKLPRAKWSTPDLLAQGELDQNLLHKLINLSPRFKVVVDPEDLL